MKIYKNYRSELYYFLTIDTLLPADDPLRLRKNLFGFIIKMTLTDELKVLDDKNKANPVQCNSDREAAKFYALSSVEFEKYKILDWWRFKT